MFGIFTKLCIASVILYLVLIFNESDIGHPDSSKMNTTLAIMLLINQNFVESGHITLLLLNNSTVFNITDAITCF